MKKFTFIYIFIFFILVLFISCVSQQKKMGLRSETVSKGSEPVQTETVKSAMQDSEEEIIAEFDGVTITKKDKKIAKSEIEEIVKNLNTITEERDYTRWLLYLSSAYKTEYSKLEVLRKTSESLPGIAKGIRLKDLNDYFSYVFVPSRQQMRVDDIKYLSPSKVQVLKKDKTGLLILYSLEKINGKWLLVP